jgi:general secretion pathway protein B
MSFILDALKKSESDRQRQNGPALFEVKVAPPRTRLPAWAIAIAALLVVNIGIVMWIVMRHPARPGADGAAASASASAQPSVPVAVTPAPAASTPAAPAAATPGAGAAPLTALASAQGAAPALSTAPATAVSAPAAGSAAGGGAAGTAPAPEGANPDDYTPAEDAPAAAAGNGQFGGHVRRGTASGVPLYQDAAATPGTQIPPLRLDLHVFAVRAQDRFVMINMHKVHEGDTLPEGVHVDNITPDGAVLSYNGSRFLLPRE